MILKFNPPVYHQPPKSTSEKNPFRKPRKSSLIFFATTSRTITTVLRTIQSNRTGRGFKAFSAFVLLFWGVEAEFGARRTTMAQFWPSGEEVLHWERKRERDLIKTGPVDHNSTELGRYLWKQDIFGYTTDDIVECLLVGSESWHWFGLCFGTVEPRLVCWKDINYTIRKNLGKTHFRLLLILN